MTAFVLTQSDVTEDTQLLLDEGWTESLPGGLICSADPFMGGIIDQNIPTGTWFVIFNDSRFEIAEGFATRDEAVEYFVTVSF